MEDSILRIDDIYVPMKKRQTLDAGRVESLAESILANGQLTPINVRPDGDRYVLMEGLHRLEACRALGEETIVAFVGRARQH